MFSNSLRASLVAMVVTSAVVVSATPSLLVNVTGPPAVTGVDNLVMKTTVTNTGDEILTLLNDPQSPLSKLPANTFIITDATGDTPAFTGIKAKYVPAKAIAAGKDAVTVLAPGQSIEVEHNLSEAYAFNKEGEYNIVSNNKFYLVNAQKEAVPIYATTEGHNATLTGKLAVRRPIQIKRATFNGCSTSEQIAILSAAFNAQTYAADAVSYLDSYNSSTTRFVTWFGSYTSSRHTTVTTLFEAISSNTFSSYAFDCVTCGTSPDIFAYVSPDNFGVVYICDAFWDAPTTGMDSKAGTIIHEASHFTVNGGTEDYAYGQEEAKQLAIDDPEEAIFNADNYQYFAENDPALP